MMSGDMVISVFVTVVDELMNMEGVENAYVLTNAGRYINFNTADFRGMLGVRLARPDVASQLETAPAKATREILGIFKKMGLIISDDDKFTTTQWIHGKARRVITVDRVKYDTIRGLTWGVSN